MGYRERLLEEQRALGLGGMEGRRSFTPMTVPEGKAGILPESEHGSFQTPYTTETDIERKRALTEMGASSVLGTVGALGGAALGGPPGAFIGGLGGSALGGVGARAAMEGTDSPNIKGAAARSLIGEGIGQAVAGPMGRLGGSALKGVQRIAEHPISRYIPGLRGAARISEHLTGPSRGIEPGAKAVQEHLQRQGQTLSAGQVSTSTTIDVLENIARGSLGGRAGLTRQRLGAQTALKTDIDEITSRLVATVDPDVRARLIQGALDEESTAFYGHTSAKFADLDDMLREMGIEERVHLLSPDLVMRQGARKESTELLSPQVVVRKRDGSRVPAQSYLTGGPKEFVPEPEGAVHMTVRRQAEDPDSVAHVLWIEKSAPRVIDIRDIKTWAVGQLDNYRLQNPPTWLTKLANDNEDFLTFKQAHALRREIGASVPDPVKTPSFEGGQLKKAYALVNEQMEAAGNALPPGAFEKYKEITKFVREGNETYNNTFIRSILNKEEPETIYKAAVKNEHPTRIIKLKQALKHRDDFEPLWEDIQGQWFQDSIFRATGPDGSFNANVWMNELNRLGGPSGAAERALFGERGLKYARFLGEAMQLAQKEAGESGVGGVAIQLQQPGAIVTLGTTVGAAVAGGLGVSGTDKTTAVGAGTGVAAAIVLGPAAISKLFRDQRFVNYLVSGIKAPIGSRTASRAFGQAMARADQLGSLDKPLASMFGAPKGVEQKQAERREGAKSAGAVLRERIMEKQQKFNPLGTQP